MIMLGRKAVRIILAVTFLGLFLGLTPIGLLSDVRFQILAIVLGVVILVEHWRGLITETAVGYAKWYEDIDARSTVFLVGVGLLTVGAASLFLASTGDRDASAHVAEKLAGLVGLLIASVAAAHVRAARDAAARERARRRETPHVLYLRSFGDDRLRVSSPLLERRGLERLSWRRTELFEDVIARTLSTIGPVVAIARPGTGQRDLGAARDSIVVDDWLTAVKSYMSNALLVAVVMGTSEGLVRELETLGELGLLNRVCVFVPPVDNQTSPSVEGDVLERQTPVCRAVGHPGGDAAVARPDHRAHQLSGETSGADCVEANGERLPSRRRRPSAVERRAVPLLGSPSARVIPMGGCAPPRAPRRLRACGCGSGSGASFSTRSCC